MNCNISRREKFALAAQQWIDSRRFVNGSTRARYVAPGTIKSYEEYIRALNRFFKDHVVEEIHLGHIREYQAMRTSGELGIPADKVVELCAKQQNKTVEQLKADPFLWQWTEQKIERARVQVNPNKVNQEVFTLVTILKRAKCWTDEMKEDFEYLQRQEKDIPRALTPEEQDHWIQVSGSRFEWRKVHLYSTLAFRATATNCEMRHIRLCDAFEATGIVQVQARTAKNRFRIRSMPLPPDAQWALRELLADARELGSTQPQHYLFPFRIVRNHFDPSRPMSNSGIKKPWDEIRKAAGLPHFRIHDTRHTAITRLAEAGTPIGVIMSMSGHIEEKMVRHYTQICEQAQRMAVNAAYEGNIYAVPRRPVQSAEYQHRQRQGGQQKFSY
jgi:integrase